MLPHSFYYPYFIGFLHSRFLPGLFPNILQELIRKQIIILAEMIDCARGPSV